MSNSAKRLALQSRRSRVAELYLKGYRSAQAIVDALADGVSRPTIGRDLLIIRKEWSEAMVRDFDQAIGEELARLDQIEREAWAEWERFKHLRLNAKTGADPRYLERVGWCIERRIKLLGLDAPERRELSGPGGGPIQVAAASLSDEQLAQIAAQGLPPVPALESSPESPADSPPK